MIVLGSGPSGEKAAVQAAKLGRSVMVVDRRPDPGGNCLHTGTIPSKTLRESVLFINMMKRGGMYGINLKVDKDLTVNRLMYRKNVAIQALASRVENTLERNDIDLAQGEATFLDPNTVQVHDDRGMKEVHEAEHFVIATGSRPFRPDFVDFSKERVRDSDTILGIEQIPRTMTIIGAGVVGCEYATIFSNLGVKVNLVNPRQVLLDFLDLELSNALTYMMREQGIRIRLGETLTGVECDERYAHAYLESGKVLKTEYLLMANGRTGNTDGMGLEELGLTLTRRAQVPVNEYFQTALPHIYAVGDVVGNPALAATAMEQGRLATLHAFGKLHRAQDAHLMPTGIYTIPEISTVGATEEQLTREKVPYEVGTASYRELARGQINGNTTGRLKLLFHRETLALLGVHVLGDDATDIVHIGQTVMAFQGGIDYFVDHVFNYPTYSEAYRVAALNGLNRL